MKNIDGDYLIFILILILLTFIYLSMYYSKSLTDKYKEILNNLKIWFFSLYTSKDGKTLITNGIL